MVTFPGSAINGTVRALYRGFHSAEDLAIKDKKTKRMQRSDVVKLLLRSYSVTLYVQFTCRLTGYEQYTDF